VAYQEPFFRQPHERGETRTQRTQRSKESDVWKHSVQAIGRCPAGVGWVHVGDRGADIFAFFEACRQQNCDFLVRVCQNRRMLDPQGKIDYVRSYAARLPAVSEQLLELPAKGGRPARPAKVSLAFAPLTLSAGWMNAKSMSIPTWVIRVWEIHPPADVEPLEWVLLTSVATQTVAQAWERVDWYRCRWLAEDFHQCLKTGCQIEQPRLEEATSLLRLLAILSPVAVQLLSLREQSRLQPDQPAAETLPADLVHLVADLSERSFEGMTLADFWRGVAQQGGYQGRKSDGPPGWKSIWHGWSYVQSLLRGFRLASSSQMF
jgi:hypothetical protein